MKKTRGSLAGGDNRSSRMTENISATRGGQPATGGTADELTARSAAVRSVPLLRYVLRSQVRDLLIERIVEGYY